VSTIDSLSDDPGTETRNPLEPCECDVCEDEYVLRDGYSGRYCSETCYWKGAAHVALNELRREHEYCCNCARKLKDVEPPTRANWSNDKYKPIPECAIGRAGFEPTTQTGLAEMYDRADPLNGEWHFEPEHPETTGQFTEERQVCECGACNYRTVFTTNRSKAEFKIYAKRVSAAVETLYDEGKHDFPHSRDLFLHAALSSKEKPNNQHKDRTTIRNALATSMCLTADGTR